VGEQRHLYLLRHAKSDWADAATPDHERPLAPRGRKDAKRLASYLRRAKLRPDLVLCSSAARAVETYELIAEALGHSAMLSVEDELYGASWQQLLARLTRLPGELAGELPAGSDMERVLVVGHNPTLEELVSQLAGDGDKAAISQLREKFPTAALAALRFPGPWAALVPGAAYLESVVVPTGLG
jgi:phosphohistidine phosphatase